ncbi:flagellar hook assembly protein FlgD [Bacillus infantis]|uniref:flagellar hook assembly protein FlgD n=1 Tax=Bacillus infantis TaxID=324767 RepID=UPI001CD26569|nr:flagellar hook assembly protein FlgD [Bacillus infantis]MCA1040778.1 flagellar hook assembly protein FlgD [Bacillus infantis]
MANTIDSSLMLSSYKKEERKTGSDILGKDDFLKILMVQLQNQDPTNPLQDKDFIAQMATFSSLEQMTNMNTNMQKLVQMQEQDSLIAYSEFAGREIKWHKVAESEDPNAQPSIEEGTGRVASIQFKNGNAVFILEDGTELAPANISEVKGGSQDNSLMQASMLIGRLITYVGEDGTEQKDSVKSVSLKGGVTLFQLGNGTAVNSSQITEIE